MAQQTLKEKSITMSNTLARAAQGLSLSEKRIVCLALTKINPRRVGSRVLALESGFTVDISATKYADIFGVSLDVAYRHLKAAGVNLEKREACYNELISGAFKIKKINWVTSAPYHGAWLKINFTKEIAAHLFELPGEFTSYYLHEAADLKSIYAWRLLECLKSWRLKKSWEVKMEDFYTAMDATAGYKKDYSSLRTRIIEPAKNGLNKTKMSVDCVPVKEGRKLISLRFTFENPIQIKSRKTRAANKPVNEGKKSSALNLEQERLDQISNADEEAEYRRNNPQDYFDKDNY